MKKTLLILIILISSLIIFPSVFGSSALRITPAYHKIIFEPGMEFEAQFLITTYGSKYLNVVPKESELSKYVTLKGEAGKDSIIEVAGRENIPIKYNIKFPDEPIKPGDYRIDIRAVIIPQKNSNMVGAVAGVSHTIFVVVPRDGPYAEIRIEEASDKLETDSIVEVPIIISNYGSTDLKNLQASLEITDIRDKSHVASLKTNSLPILKEKDSKGVIAEWNTTGLSAGDYKIDAVLDYSPEMNPATDSEIYRLGSRYINIINVSGSIRGLLTQIDVDVESMWNKEIKDVSAFLDLYTLDDAFIGSSKTSAKDIDAFGKDMLSGFIETNSLEEGRYKLDVELDYDGQQSNKSFEINIIRDKMPIEESPMYKLIASNALTWLLLIIIILLGLYIARSFMKDHKDKKKVKKTSKKRLKKVKKKK